MQKATLGQTFDRSHKIAWKYLGEKDFKTYGDVRYSGYAREFETKSPVAAKES